MPEIKIGGSFAPPLSKDKLSAYLALAATAPPAIGEVMLSLCAMVEKYFGHTPSKKVKGVPHPTGVAVMTPLEAKVVEALDPLVPWMHECKMYGELFEQLPSGTSEERGLMEIKKDGKIIKHRATHEKELEILLYEDNTPVRDEHGRILGADGSTIQLTTIAVVVDQAAYDLRNAAFHLLWYAQELTQDRVPLTADQLPKDRT